MAATVIGSTEQHIISTRKRWTPTEGTVEETNVTGPKAAVDKDFDDRLKMVEGTKPYYDEVTQNTRGGASQLTAVRVLAGSDALVGQASFGGADYELVENEFQKPVSSAYVFKNLTDEEVALARLQYEKGTLPSVAATTFATAGISSPNATYALYLRYWHGIEYITEAGYVLRQTRTVNRRSSLLVPDYTKVNQVVQFADLPKAGDLSADLDALKSAVGGAWLKKSPRKTRNGRSYTLSQEWWWALKWDWIYGGSWLKPVDGDNWMNEAPWKGTP